MGAAIAAAISARSLGRLPVGALACYPTLLDARNGGAGAAYLRMRAVEVVGGARGWDECSPQPVPLVLPSPCVKPLSRAGAGCAFSCTARGGVPNQSPRVLTHPRSLWHVRPVLALSSHLLSSQSIARWAAAPLCHLEEKRTGNTLFGESIYQGRERNARLPAHLSRSIFGRALRR